MKILWVVNILLPEIASGLNVPSSNREGWLSGIFERMDNSSSEYELSVAYPTMDASFPEVISIRGINCYSFYEDLSRPEIYDEAMEERLGKIIKKVSPDILHIFGTEFPHALAAAISFNRPEKTLVGIQGICQKIAEDYMSLIPKEIENKVTFRDLIKKDSLRDQKNKFIKRAANEKRLLENTLNITGRTAFDKEYSLSVNPKAGYFKMNETMRKPFYEGSWDIDKARKHSIFIGQADYPLKGMHFLLQAVGSLLDIWPDIKITVAGNSIIKDKTLKDKLKTPAYGAYLKKLIKENHLQDHIEVLGNLSADEMKEAYLKSSVYISASYIENSPNTVCEAMLLGVPVIASTAGGTCDLISEEEGYIFEKGDIDELALKIREVFKAQDNKDPSLTKKCARARKRAHMDYDRESNYNRLMEIYGEIKAD